MSVYMLNLLVWLPGFILVVLVTHLHKRMLIKHLDRTIRANAALIALSRAEADMNMDYMAYIFRLTTKLREIDPNGVFERVPDDNGRRKQAREELLRAMVGPDKQLTPAAA